MIIEKNKTRRGMMTEQEISNKCKSLDASNDTFKNIIKDCKNPKFNNLDKWQHFQLWPSKKKTILI